MSDRPRLGHRRRSEPPLGSPSSPVRSRGALAALAVIVVVLGVGVTRLSDLLPRFGNPFATETVDRSQPALLQAIEDLAEYRAATGQFQVIIDVEDDTRSVPSFVRGERTLFLAGGTVGAYVDFAGLAEHAIAEHAIKVSDDDTAVIVRLPPARLSEPRIDPSTAMWSSGSGACSIGRRRCSATALPASAACTWRPRTSWPGRRLKPA